MFGPGRVVLSVLFAFVLFTGTAAAAEESEPVAATVYSPTFADVPNEHLFATSIRALFASGITRGCNPGSTRFCPERSVTRGEMAAFLTRALDLPDNQGFGFTDDNGHTFEQAIESLAAAGITKGCNPPTNDRYCPDQPITRGQMAAFLTRALELPHKQGFGFTDDNGHTFEQAIESLAAAGITKGCNPPTNDRYCPDQPITRGQMAAFLTRGLSLPVPDSVPEGVSIEWGPPSGPGVGVAVSVCRNVEMSLTVRSVAGADPALPDVAPHEPTDFIVSNGVWDPASDEWSLPAGEGCDLLDAHWDPRANVVLPPLPTLVVASHFGPRHHPILGYTRLHAGTDFEADQGDFVFAAAFGVVVDVGPRGGYGNLVEIWHRGGLVTRYAHLSTMAVTIGDLVAPGDLVGEVGCTGLCTAPHLHFETREFDEPIDPMSYLG